MEPHITDIKHVSQITLELQKDLMKRGTAPELPLRSMPGLNKRIWGLHKQKLTLIGARPSNGKSAMAINMAHDLACQGKKVLFLSLEMPRVKILERMFCLHSQVDNMELLKGAFNHDQMVVDKHRDFSMYISKCKMYIADCIGRDWAWLDINVFQNMKDKPDAVFIDHIQEIRGGQSSKEAMDEYISRMRECAIRHNFALVMCSQMNRTAVSDKDSDKMPQLHNLKSTGFLEEAADIVAICHWPYHYAKDDENVPRETYIVNVAKNRDGMTGYVQMRYQPEYCRITDSGTKEDKTNEKVEWNE